MNHPTVRHTWPLWVITAMFLLEGCGGPPPVTGEIHLSEARSQRLMVLAVVEAGKIGDPDMRLTRELNLADLQIERRWADNARDTLTAARQTLGSPEAAKLNDQTRLSGWVSISQLSRMIRDDAAAAVATDTALSELEKIEDPARRCQYVMGLANELQYIKGKPAAAALLAKAGPWTKWIDSLSGKRQALVAFATALFNLNDFDAGQKMIEQETDAAWRSDVLAAMAQAAQEAQVQTASVEGTREMAAEAHVATVATPPSFGPATQPFYGQQLNYEQNFKNKKISSTTKE